MRPVCLDASVVLKLVVVEPGSEHAAALWRRLGELGARPIAPALLLFECVSALRRMVQQRTLAGSAARLALDRLLALPIAFPAPDGLVDRAWQLAAHFGQLQAYDSFYLALAELMDATYWTADRRFHDAVRRQCGFARLLGGDPLPE